MSKKIAVETQTKILDFVKENFEVATKDIVEFLAISPQATHKHLKKLVEVNRLKKMGNPPKVFYKISDNNYNLKSYNLLTEDIKSKFKGLKILKLWNEDYKENVAILSNIEKITEHSFISTYMQKVFIFISPEGDILEGLTAFLYWCEKRKLPVSKTLLTFIELQEKYEHFKTPDSNFIIATDKFKQVFGNDNQVDEVYYCDFYSIEIFGKTKLGSLLLHGKQAQNLKIIQQVCNDVKDRILEFIKKNKIDAVAFIPPTTPRKPQFMDEFRKILNINLPIIKLEKVVNDIAIQQKTLKSSQDRTENAQNTIFVDDKRVFKNILLLDDAVGSGSTFNEIARKIRQKKLVQNKIYALAIVGSANGIIDNQKKFEVINEV
jgi:DNA-binding Lrp family transcriptional regulator